MADERKPHETGTTRTRTFKAANAELIPEPRFVGRRRACALLDLSDAAFRGWQRRGLLPPPVAGSPDDEPRWDWHEIQAWMRGDRSSAPRDLLGEVPPAITGKRKGPAPGTGGRPRKIATTSTGEHDDD